MVLGVFEKDYTNSLVLRDLFYKEASIVGSNCYCGMRDFREASFLIKKYKKKFEKLITHKLSLKEFGDAIKLIKNKKREAVIKIIFKP